MGERMRIEIELKNRTKKSNLVEAQKIIEEGTLKISVSEITGDYKEKIKEFNLNVDTHVIRGIYRSPVNGEKYTPEMRFTYEDNKRLIKTFTTSCNCWYHRSHNFCSHVAALIMLGNSRGLIERTAEQLKAFNRSKLIKKTIDFIEIFSAQNTDKRIITLDCRPFITNENSQCRLILDINIGTAEGKKYKLNSKMNNFLKAYQKSEYSFGKDFTYSPGKDVFDSKSQKIMEILLTIDEIGSQREEEDFFNYGYEILSQNFTKLGTLVPNLYIKKVIDILELKSLGKFNIKSSEPKINFEVEKKDENIEIRVSGISKIVPLGDSILLSQEEGGTLHYSSENRVKVLENIKKQMELKNNYLFLSLLAEHTPLPKLLKSLGGLGETKIGKNLEKEILIPKEIKNAIYVESYGQYGIKLREKTLYDGKTSEEHAQIVLTDRDESILKNYEKDFKLRQISDHEYLLEEDEEIYEFMTEKVKVLKEKADIFYEDKFARRKYSAGKVSTKGGLKDGILHFEFSIENIGNDEIEKLLKTLKERKKFFRLKDGGIIKFENSDFDELEKILTTLKADKEEIRKGKILREKRYSYFIRQRMENMSGAVVSQGLKKFANEMETVDEIEIPAQFSMLREYQKYGVSWLCFLKKYGLGGILADDMGLGKTLQVITFLSLTLKEAGGSTLIIVPKSLMYNWKSEFERFAPEVSVKILDGTKKSREEIFSKILPGDVILTSYGTIHRDRELYQKIEFENIILDEAQNIKNIGTKTTQGVKEIKGRDRFALTGTPVENNLMELWSIFDFMMPGYLKNHSDFEKKFIKTINYKMLKSLTAPFILRRMKKDVLTELPEKIESSIPVELYPEQKKIYLSYLKKAQQEVQNSGENSMVMLSVLTRLRQICSHPGMFLEEYRGESSKIDLILELLAEYKESGHRVLVFSQFTKIFQIIKDKIGDEYTYKYLDGATPSKERIKLVESFNRGEGDFFMISLKAGGTGLNLTGADIVIHMDPWWNPAVEDQATDRAYRMGQKNVVNVLKLISVGTIEEQIDSLKLDKKSMIQEVFEGEGKDIMKLDKKEILELLKK